MTYADLNIQVGATDFGPYAPQIGFLAADGTDLTNQVSANPSGGFAQDASNPSTPQRITFVFDVVFPPTTTAFGGLAVGDQRVVEVMAAKNFFQCVGPILFVNQANPYFPNDGSVGWLSDSVGQSTRGSTSSARTASSFAGRIEGTSRGSASDIAR